MLTVIAIGFPVIATIIAWILARPQEVLRRFPAVSGNVDRSLLPERTHFWWTGTYLALTYCIAAVTAVIQHLLFREASPSSTWTFSSRLTDSWMFAFVPGLLGGMHIAFPLHVRLLSWHYGERLVDVIDRRGRGRTGYSLRQDLVIFPRLTIALIPIVTILNAAAFDTFLQVGGGVFRYSGFLTPLTTEFRVADVREIELTANRIAPSGSVTNRKSLVLRMRDGTVVDTYYLIEDWQIPAVVAAFQAAGRPIPFKQRLGEKRRRSGAAPVPEGTRN